jgi:hypothetical protein
VGVDNRGGKDMTDEMTEPQHNFEREWDKETSNLYQHAKRELQLAGMFDKDTDYGGMLGEATLRLIETFAKEGHSGFSAAYCRALFQKLSNYENLTEITDNLDEWMSVDKHLPETCQNKRNPALFSTDAGKTYYSVDEKPRKIFGIRLPRKIYKSKKTVCECGHGH